MDLSLIASMSDYLMYRHDFTTTRGFSKYTAQRSEDAERYLSKKKEIVKNADDLDVALRQQVADVCKGQKVALALSGGIDSAILASYLPPGTKAYTFRCVVPGVEVIDESCQAEKYAQKFDLDWSVVDILFKDVEDSVDELMIHKGAPLHSIEVQIYKAANIAKSSGVETMIFGELADAYYGGQSSIFSKEWMLREFVNRYSYINPADVLKLYEYNVRPCLRHTRKDGYVDVLEFFRNEYAVESIASYLNACSLAGLKMCAPFARTWLGLPLDYNRIKRGENKYIVRELFLKKYPGWSVPPKIPMPRATNEWFAKWSGPVRKEFIPNCHVGFTGDQCWLLYCLERYLNLIEERYGYEGV